MSRTMSAVRRSPWLLLLLTIGCQPAMHYEADKPAAAPGAAAAEGAEPAVWLEPLPGETAQDAPIEFIPETDGAWSGLPKYWNPPPTAEEKAGAALISPLTAAPLAALKETVRIKVPAGLDDPRPFLPSDPADPPTLNKWRLGRDLFYDPTWLSDAGSDSCATCHQPGNAFTDGRNHDGFHTPTLVNCVFNRRQFWDGRVPWLEEVVQQTAADETAPAVKLPFHAWNGVVRRLRASDRYAPRFRDAFGALPTQDAVGKALAAYLRTLLAADSVYDRAVRKAGAAELKAEHFEKALDDADLKRLGPDAATKADAAQKIYRGYRLFHDLEEHKTGCILCHGGPEFADGKFHNIGVGLNWSYHLKPGDEPGRFASLPIGLKESTMVGAYKTPTLRGLTRTGPYFHDGSQTDLMDVILFHIDGGGPNPFLDPALRNPVNPDVPRTWDVPAADREALLLFLRSLEGGEVDAAVGPAPP